MEAELKLMQTTSNDLEDEIDVSQQIAYYVLAQKFTLILL